MAKRLQLTLLATIVLSVYPSVAAAINETLTGGTVQVLRDGGSNFEVNGHFQATGGYDISLTFVGGAFVSAFDQTSFRAPQSLIDGVGITVIRGSTIFHTCGNIQLPAFPCAAADAGAMMAAPPPAFTGDLHPTVPGTFGIALDVSLSESGSDLTLLHFLNGGGPAAITLDWLADSQQWRFASGIGFIEPIPEPATLLLSGTSIAAGVLYHRRRRLTPGRPS